MESDKSGDSATAFDICFHPEALKAANENKRVKELLVKTAIDGVQEAYKRQKQDVSSFDLLSINNCFFVHSLIG
jgi:hypothetical protein